LALGRTELVQVNTRELKEPVIKAGNLGLQFSVRHLLSRGPVGIVPASQLSIPDWRSFALGLLQPAYALIELSRFNGAPVGFEEHRDILALIHADLATGHRPQDISMDLGQSRWPPDVIG
jgi:hypothetical protein